MDQIDQSVFVSEVNFNIVNCGIDSPREVRFSTVTPAVHDPIISLDTPEFRVQRVLVTVADDRNGCLPNGEKAGDQQTLLIEEQFNAAWSKNQLLAAGIAAASGEHIIICDADVWITS